MILELSRVTGGFSTVMGAWIWGFGTASKPLPGDCIQISRNLASKFSSCANSYHVDVAHWTWSEHRHSGANPPGLLGNPAQTSRVLLRKQCPTPCVNEPQNHSPGIRDDAYARHSQRNRRAEKLLFDGASRCSGRGRAWEAEPGTTASAKTGQSDLTPSPSSLSRSPASSPQPARARNDVRGARALSIA